jgi:UPF0271 protein
MSVLTVDLNSDVGESFGAYQMGTDEAIMPYITSANIACGFHAGDPAVMKKTVRLAIKHNVAIGAHPGLPDLAGFGRRELAISAVEAFDMVVYQTGALWGFVKAEGGKLHHIKPHGALYTMAAVNATLAEAIAEAVYQVNPEILLYGLAGSELIKAGNKIGLHTANEVFADRTYQPDGTLTPRRLANAMISDTDQAVSQVVRMVKEGKVVSLQGTDFSIKPDTICIHGDSQHALALARHIHEALIKEGILIKAFTGENK